jgi:hypothetical protein
VYAELLDCDTELYTLHLTAVLSECKQTVIVMCVLSIILSMYAYTVYIYILPCQSAVTIHRSQMGPLLLLLPPITNAKVYNTEVRNS